MAARWDLREQPWIPVRFMDGATGRVGFRELFHRAHEIEDVELPVPPAASGLLRVLAAMTARVARVDGERLDDRELAEDIEDWLALRDRVLAQGRFDGKVVDAYFDDEVPCGRFDLFDAERPFLQDPRLRDECLDAKGNANPSGVNKLVFGRPTGVNGAVLFGHFTDGDPVPVPAAEATWHMIAQLYYGPSGQCTPRRITADKPGNGLAGPLRKSVSFHVWAEDLFTTLVLAVPGPNDQIDLDEADLCPWEEELPNPLAPPRPLTWPGRWLTGRARHAVLLEPSAGGTHVTDAYVTWSTHQPPSAAPDPHVILDMPKAGGAPFARAADQQRALWRDLDALLLKDDGQGQRPLCFEYLPAQRLTDLRVRAYGFDQDGQQRDHGWFEATTPAVLGWLEGVSDEGDAMALHIARCHQAAEQVGERLEYAAKLAWKLATDPPEDTSAKVTLDRKRPGPWARTAMGHYWPAAERVFWQLATPQQLDAPAYQPFVTAALESLDAAMGAARADLRGARARSRARAALHAVIPHSQRTVTQSSR
ncbi:type I-E CRISPR-associated protein Cse1/CasA [Streptomyces sp. RB6PN23]|uniref:Type I-E CRISPR-associated protein Cse1/CasA n=2 Tax=Streptomyces silvisoli TaxID=3034235 RepID=A0ABT5ZRC0_9ACTN|nr:type I-E CRISPR-associated protein Cse1/CasA [Streptomyces silvisoli]